MTMELLIELATIDDVPELARLRWALYSEQDGEAPESLDAFVERFAEFAERALVSGRWRAWVARADGRPVGAMWLQTVQRIPVPGKRAGPIGYLTNVYIAPEHRDLGLGSRMLEHLIEGCRSDGYSVVIVWPTDRSRPFYGRVGFARPGEPLVLELAEDPPIPSEGSAGID